MGIGHGRSLGERGDDDEGSTGGIQRSPRLFFPLLQPPPTSTPTNVDSVMSIVHGPFRHHFPAQSNGSNGLLTAAAWFAVEIFHQGRQEGQLAKGSLCPPSLLIAPVPSQRLKPRGATNQHLQPDPTFGNSNPRPSRHATCENPVKAASVPKSAYFRPLV